MLTSRALVRDDCALPGENCYQAIVRQKKNYLKNSDRWRRHARETKGKLIFVLQLNGDRFYFCQASNARFVI